MKRALGSIAIHLGLAAGAWWARRAPVAPATDDVPALAVIDYVDVVAEPTLVPPPIALPRAADPGGTGGRVRTPRPDRPPLHPLIATADDTGADVTAIVGEVRIDRDGAGAGAGDGTGLGWGDGSGYGVGVAAPPSPPLPPPPPPPPPDPGPPATSKARPARLVYPSKQVQIAEEELFVARLTVDDEGFVVGAHLARGFGGKRDDDAMSAVWRFRYSPALDEDGRPVRSTVEQHFDVSR